MVMEAERAIRFGRSDHLAGVLTQPDPQLVQGQCPAVIIPNAGFVHHVGPFRLHVSLARALANKGIASLRFDLSGLGDSAVARERLSTSQRKNADIKDAMDFMAEALGHSKMIVAGLCSGASDAHRVALSDSRVETIVMIDPTPYRNRWFYLRRALDARRVLRALRARMERVGKSAAKPESQRIHKVMPRQEFADQVEANVLRGARYLFVYLGRRSYNHRGQIYSSLTPATPRSQVDVLHYGDFDHTLIFQNDRGVVIDAVAHWIASSTEVDAPAAAATADAA